MTMIQFVNNFEDLSTDKGYQFKFHCDQCDGYMSHFQTSTLGVTSSFLNTASNLLGWGPYVHQSPCVYHDRANTNEAINEDVATVGGDFSFSFPIDPTQKTIRGSITVEEQDGSKTDYT